MIRLRLRLLLLPVASCLPAVAHADGEVWTSTSISGPVSGKVRASLDAIGRFDGGGLYEWVAAGSLGYQFDEHATVWAGYVHKSAYANNSSSIEQRFREDLTLDDVARIGPVRVGGRLRAEERWRDGASGLAWRVRPQLRLTLPLVEKGPALVAGAESFINLGGGAGQRSGYDRTRASFGVAVPLTKKVRLDVGYLRQWTRGADTANAATVALSYRW